MPFSTPREAVEEFLQPLRRVVSSVTPSVLNVRGGYHPSEKPHSVIIGDGLPVRLAGPGQLSLRMVHHYRVSNDSGERGWWKVNTAAYYYALEERNGREIISYHWHPESRSPIRFPHLHVGPAAGRLCESGTHDGALPHRSNPDRGFPAFCYRRFPG